MLGVQKWMGERGKWSLGPLIDDIDDGVVAPALRCAHLTPEGHLEDVGNVGTGHHQLHWGGADGHWGVWYRVVHYCTRIDELCVPTDEISWVFLNYVVGSSMFTHHVKEGCGSSGQEIKEGCGSAGQEIKEGCGSAAGD